MSATPQTVPYASPSTNSSSDPRVPRRAAFIIAVVILGLAAVGLNAATEFMQLHFKKQPVPLAQPLDTIPTRLGSWVQVSKDKPLNHELQDVLGTDKYVFRDFLDERIVGKEAIEQFKDLSWNQRDAKVAEIQRKNPEAVINLSLTYYTGMVDTVAHIPDRCVIADGYQPIQGQYTSVKWPVGKDGEVESRFIGFEDQTGAGRVNRNIAYFFHVNGHYESDPLGVRSTLQKLTEQHGYYMKIEVMSLMPDHKASAKAMTDFLGAALPEVEKCLPDWEQVKRGAVK